MKLVTQSMSDLERIKAGRSPPRGQHLVLFPSGEDSAAHDGYLGNPKAWLPNETLGAAG